MRSLKAVGGPRTTHLAPLILLALVLAGCVSGPFDAARVEDPAGLDETTWRRVHIFDGELRAPGDTLTFPFTVLDGANEVETLLTWSDSAAQLGFRLMAPNGEEAARGWNEGDGRAYVTTTHPVEDGEWTLDVTAERAFLTTFAATTTVHSDAVMEGPIATTFVIPPRNPARALPAEARAVLPSAGPRDYAEINLNMAPTDAFRFSWNASSEVYFNVHYHGADGTTERPIEERSRSLAGEFTANATEVYALLWRNEGTSEVEVEVALDGSYRLHSMTRRS